MQSDPELIVHVTDEMIRHSRILDMLYFGGFVYGVVELLIILGLRISAQMRDMAARAAKRPYLIAMIYVVLFTLVTALFDFPLSYYAGYVVPHQFNLTNQTFGDWLGDEGKALLIGLIISIILIPLALLGIRKFRRWWLVLWIGSIPVMILLVVIAPIFIDPVFNKFEPLKDQVLKQKLIDEAARAGIEAGRVYQVDKSKQTKEMNGYVTGLGPTKRIVMWDTLLAKLNQDEILAVMGHEMGHYVLHHLWQGLAWAVVIALIILFVGQRVYEWGLGRWGARWGIPAPGDPASLPWLLVIVSVASFILAPIENGISRHYEHQSDKFGLDLTHLNHAMATSFVKFAEDSKVNPRPHPFIEFWRYSHPSLARRIDFVLHYKPWEKKWSGALQSGAARFSAPNPTSTATDNRLASSRSLPALDFPQCTPLSYNDPHPTEGYDRTIHAARNARSGRSTD